MSCPGLRKWLLPLIEHGALSAGFVYEMHALHYVSVQLGGFREVAPRFVRASAAAAACNGRCRPKFFAGVRMLLRVLLCVHDTTLV
jgi:hypothetical protein